MANIPLDAFNGRLHYRTAWEYDRKGVIKFMEQVVDDLPGHGVHSRWTEFAGTIRNHILRLKPDEAPPKEKRPGGKQPGGKKPGRKKPRQDEPGPSEPGPSEPGPSEPGPSEPGEKSASYSPIPPQYLYRRELAYIPPSPPSPEVKPVTFELDPKPVSDHLVYGMYDFIGFFLSLSPAPNGATMDRFFAPWLVLYWKWAKLFKATFPEMQHSKLEWKRIEDPSVLQCTWRRGRKENNPDEEEIIFHMGASTGGFAKVGTKSEYGLLWKREKNDWQQSIVRFRFNILAGPLRIINSRYEWENAPMYELTQDQADAPAEDHPTFLEKNAQFGWDFGNCAETYPFLEILREACETNKEKYEGISIKTDAMKTALNLTPETIGDFQTPTIHPPCRNCTYLLDNKYRIGTGSFKAPTDN